MSTSSHRPEKPIALERVKDWIDAARRKRLELHLLAVDNFYSNFTTLLQDLYDSAYPPWYPLHSLSGRRER